MSRNFEVVWAKTAEADLVKIIEYIALDRPENALKILNKIKVEVFTLHQYPDRCRVVPELYAQGITQYREMIVDPWRVMYRISNDDVYVLSVFDSRQNIEDVLLNRFVL